jgi:predicted ATPase
MHLQRLVFHPERFPNREAYPFNLEILRSTEALELTTPVTFFVGENGSGKSTVLRAIARRCGIHIWEGLERARFSNNPFEEELHNYIEVRWSGAPVPGSFFAAELFRGFSQSVDEWAINDPEVLETYGGKSLLVQSHGQSHLAFFSNRFRLEGLYLLDEPENALSPKSQLLFLELLRKFSESGVSQFILSTHSPILLSLPGARIYCFDRPPLKPVEYEDTEHFQVYQRFFEQYRAARGPGR